jgi:transposase
MRWIGLDCHLEFIEVAILDAAGAAVSAGTITSSEEAIRLFAEGLGSDDRVALESSANAAVIAALIRPHVAAVVIANSRRLAQISQARAETDRLDARTLAKLLRAGALEEVWMPDERTRARRRLCSRRAALVRACTRAKNEAHAVLARNLKGRPPATLALLAVIGNVSRFGSARQLVAYLGLDPRVRQSGSGEARQGRISKQGPAQARAALVEAAQQAIREPGPLRAFGARIRARRGYQVAAVAVARKLAGLAWQLLTKGEDYAFERPQLTQRKLRRLELAVGEPRRRGRACGVAGKDADREATELAAAERAEAAYRRLVADWKASGADSARKGAGASRGRASQAARQASAPEPAR